MTRTPLVSVVVPTYKHGHLIGRMLDALVAQTWTNWEAIIVNNHSPDDTVQVVGRYADPRITLVDFENGGVIAASRNEGVRRASGRFVAFLDSDDWWRPDKLSVSVDWLEAGADVVFHDLWLVTSPDGTPGTKRVRAYQPRTDDVFADLMIRGNALPNSSVAVRTELMRDIGGLSEDRDLIGTEDFDGWLRLALVTSRFSRVPGVHGCYWAAGGNVGGDSLVLEERYRHVYGRHLPRLAPRDRLRASCVLEYFRGRVYQACREWALARRAFGVSLRSPSPAWCRLRSAACLAAVAMESRRAVTGGAA